ncbi:MAG: RDD family protein [Actinobacteria bacterium]|nr:MAG: RDD family protein [Actinomycetota bacterium]
MSQGQRMSQYEDRMTIETPEGLVVTLPLAGVGSRFVSAAIDFTIQILLTAAAFTVFVGFGVGGGVGPGLFAISVFAVFFVYDVSFEVLAGGRTPGKRWTGLRVVRSGGQPVGFVASAIRNLLRLVDFLPSVYLVGITSILVTQRNQRLGDLAGDTVVARASRKPVRVVGAVPTAPLAGALAAWDVSGITAEELATVRTFLERRDSLEWGARTALARTLAERLRPRVGGVSTQDPAGDAANDEVFLERLARVKAARM